MMLSDYFSLDELTISQEATRRGIDNTPAGDALLALTATAKKMDAVRRLLGRPILPSSGYRCPELNTLIGSNSKSDHPKGLAVDFICPGFGSVQQVFDKIRLSGIGFDQLIFEFDGAWCHIGFGPRMRRQQLIAKHVNGKTVYEVVK